MLKVLDSGFYTTIQDVGRFGYREFGVPVSGSMDLYSSQFANSILGNKNNDALLEMTMRGGVFQFSKPTTIACSGAIMSMTVNERPVRQNVSIQIKANDVLCFGRVDKGLRTYLAVKGGFRTSLSLGSRSQYEPVTASNRVVKGEILEYSTYNNEFKGTNAKVKYDDTILSAKYLQAYPGPEFNLFNANQKSRLFTSELKVSNYNNRMAYQLEPIIENELDSIITAPVLPGTVQLTPNGNLIVLMRDCQTTGGYPRVLQLTERSINILSQKAFSSVLNIRLKEK